MLQGCSLSDVFAVFVVAADCDGLIAVTTRPKGKSSPYGFPGGKVEPGETLSQAALREAEEEGWRVRLKSDEPFYTDVVKGRKVAWFAADILEKLSDYKEAHRGLRTFLACPAWTCCTGYKNDIAIEKYLQLYPVREPAPA